MGTTEKRKLSRPANMIWWAAFVWMLGVAHATITRQDIHPVFAVVGAMLLLAGLIGYATRR